MSRKIRRILILVPTGLVLILALIYVSLSLYYRQGFSYGTWINGVYCTGKGISEINEELKAKYETEPLTICYGSDVYEILPEEIGYSIDFTTYLQDILNRQEPFAWPENLFHKQAETKVIPDFIYNTGKLREAVESLSLVRDNTYPEGHRVAITDPGDGYILEDTNEERIDTEKLLNAVTEALYSTRELTVDDSFFYQDAYTAEDDKVFASWKGAEDYFETRIILDMGAEQVVLDKQILSSFVSLDEKGLFLLDEEGNLQIDDTVVRAWVDSFLDEYDTYKADRKFKTHTGAVKTIKLVMYGTLTDHDDLYERVLDSLKNHTSQTLVPEYLHTAYVRGKNDIGDTYVEIDMGEQVLYYYEKGELLLKTDIVTGKPASPTPEMVTRICSKSRDVILKGDNYASFVSYWVPIYPIKGIGLHDASWQSAFGGDRYLTHGSHGCVNMIKEDIAWLYDRLEIGMPVICYQ